MISKTKKLRKKLTIPLYLIIAFSLVIAMVGVFFLVQRHIPKPRVLYHGPNPITMGKVIKSEYVLGKSTSLQRKRTVRVTPAVRPQITAVPTKSPTSQPPTPTVQVPTPTPIQLSVKAGEYGIAAGGGLTNISQNDLDQYFQNLQSLGIKWVRWDIDWGDTQWDSSTSYWWDAPDRVAATAKRFGINTLAVVGYSPKWGSSGSCKDYSKCPPTDPKVFGNFAGQAAKRYKDSINYWEIWNEPNFADFIGPSSDVSKYAEIIRESYTQIKNANPQAVVITGGLAASGDESDGSISPLTFINAMYALKANQYFDAIALHPYSYPVSPNYIASWNSWQQMTLIRQLMVNKGDSNKKIWVTEYGAPTGGSGSIRELDQLTFTYGSDYMSETAQQQMVQQVTALYRQDLDWMGPFFWYSLRDEGTSKDTPENFFGLLRNDWSKKPAYDVFRNMIVLISRGRLSQKLLGK